jgi:hypothetical protein
MAWDGQAKTSRANPLDADLSQALTGQRQALPQKFGQSPGPTEPVVCDPEGNARRLPDPPEIAGASTPHDL